jgi:Gpi18-like mannosyltransferase
MARIALVAVGSRTETAPSRATSLFDREAWRDALLVWLGQHALLLLVAYVGVTLTRTSKGAPTLTWAAFFSHISGWDASLFALVARNGYTGGAAPAFAPALPLVERGGMLLTGLDPAAVGLIVSNFAMLGALGLLGVLARREIGRDGARRTILYLAIFPTAFFLDLAYSESLFLLFSVGAFLAIRDQRWILAGLLAAAATLTRQLGLLLLLPIAVTIWESYRAHGRPLIRDLAAMATAVVLPAVALGGYMLYLFSRYGTLFAESRAEELDWGVALRSHSWASCGRAVRFWDAASNPTGFRPTSS